MEFLKKIKDKAPEYDSTFEELILKFTVGQGGRSGKAAETSAWTQGKYFSTKYEIYMYATLLGLKSNYKISMNPDTKKEKFIEIRSWQPNDLAEYVIMAVIAKSKIDLASLENKEEKEVENVLTDIRKLMEEYANGGFDKIRSKFETDSSFFENNDNCFIDLLETSI